jgi:hypothetical protein
VFEVNSYQRLFQIVNNSEKLAEVLKQAEHYCQNCKVISPMICIQKCEIWKDKNELLEMNKIVPQNAICSSLFSLGISHSKLRMPNA